MLFLGKDDSDCSSSSRGSHFYSQHLVVGVSDVKARFLIAHAEKKGQGSVKVNPITIYGFSVAPIGTPDFKESNRS